MSVSAPQFLIGAKLRPIPAGEAALKQHLVSQLALRLLAGAFLDLAGFRYDLFFHLTGFRGHMLFHILYRIGQIRLQTLFVRIQFLIHTNNFLVYLFLFFIAYGSYDPQQYDSTDYRSDDTADGSYGEKSEQREDPAAEHPADDADN